MKFILGDKVAVAHDFSGGGFDEGAIGDTGVVVETFGTPNPITGVYAGLMYRSDRNGKEYAALEAELVKLP